MSDESYMLKSVEIGEGWLRQTMPADPPYAMAALKLRVRIAVHEAWLADVTAEDAVSRSGESIVEPPDLAAVRDAVRGAISHQCGEAAQGAVATPLAERGDSPGSGPERRTSSRVLRWSLMGGGLAAAAALLLAVMLPAPENATEAAASGDSAAQRLDDLAAALVEAEAKSPWADLEADIGALEDAFDDTLAEANARAWNEAEIDDLAGEFEALVSEIGQGS